MSDVTSFRVTGDWRHIVDDGMVDVDDLPDEVLPTGTVKFRPISPTVATAGVPATAYTFGTVPALIAGGVLTDIQGREGLRLVGKVGEHTVRWSAEIELTFQGQKVPYPSPVAFELEADTVLSAIIQQAGRAMTPIVLDPRIEALAGRLSDVDQVVGQAEQIVADAEQSVVDAKAHADRAIGLAGAQDEHIAGTLEDPESATHAAFKAVGNATYGTKAEVSEAVTVATSALPRSLVPAMLTDVDVREAEAPMSQTQVDLTTYVGGNNAIVHPSLLFFDEGWNGFRYWMAYTPYNNGDAQLENPCIAVSNDGEKWVTPPGLTNPVEDSPPGPGYLADPVLCMTPDGQTMLMVFKINDATRQLVLRTSTDGVTWTPKQVILDNPYEDVSPALLWDNGKYRMWTVVYAASQVATPTMFVRTADAPEGPWSPPVACTFTGLPAGLTLWHMDIKRVGQQYHAVINTNGSMTGPFFAKSADGLAWECAPHPIIQVGYTPMASLYKAAILPKITPDGFAYDMWFSSATDFRMFKTTVRFNRTSRRDALASGILAARAQLQSWLVADDFNRADSAAGLGVATTGQSWTKALGGDFAIISRQAGLPVAGNCRATIPAGAADVRVAATFSSATTMNGTTGYLMFRHVDSANLWRVGTNGYQVVLQKIVGGTLTNVAATTVVLQAGNRLEVEAKGNRIKLFLDGMEFYSVTDSALSTGTVVGLNADNANIRFDNFTVRAA